ncbi:hypothetical protein V2W45_1014307 [Cenococcum geophilum]
MSQSTSDPITALGVVVAALRAEASEHTNSEEQAHRLGQLVREIALVKERLAEEKAARTVHDNRLEEIRKAFEGLRGAQVPMSDQQVAETGLSIEQNSATDKPQASAVSSKDKSGCWPVLAIPQLPSHPQHHADHDSRLQASSPETLRAMSRAPSIVPYPSSLGMMRGPPIAPSIPAALRIFLASRARDQGLTSRASSSTASKKITSVSTKASGGGAENNWHVDAATAGSAEPVENASRPSSRDVAGGSPVSNMEKHCWKSEWYRAGKPMNLVNFVRMKRAEMRRDGDEAVELQALYYFPVKTFLIYIYRESQRPCIQSVRHQ